MTERTRHVRGGRGAHAMGLLKLSAGTGRKCRPAEQREEPCLSPQHFPSPGSGRVTVILAKK